MAKKASKPAIVGRCGDCENHFNEYNIGYEGKPIMCQCILCKEHKMLSDTCKYFKKTE